MTKVEAGKRFGSLTVTSLTTGFRPNGKLKYIAVCKCDCGKSVQVEKYNLSTGNTSRCPECAKAARGLSKRTHGHSWLTAKRGSLESKCYYTWQAIKRRCNNPGDKRYSDYGGRGIRVCAEWETSYEAFLGDMGLPPSADHQIDRIENDEGYSPGNCRWASRKENGRNKRNNSIIHAKGKSATVSEWAEETGLKRETIQRRLFRGWPHEDAISKRLRKPGRSRAVVCPLGTFESASECARQAGMSISGLFGRLASDSYPDWQYKQP